MKARATLLDLRPPLALALLTGLMLTLAASAAQGAIADLYAALPGNIGTTVSVEAFYTNPGDQKIVSDHDLWLDDQPMPIHSIILLDGPPAPPAAWEGGFVIVTGTVDTLETDYGADPLDPQAIILRDISYEVLRQAPQRFGQDLSRPWNEPAYDFGTREDCDSCKFAIIISGGINARNNNARYWNNIEMLYKLKTDSLGYCPGNVTTLYYKGNSENTAVIPDAAVDSCTLAKVKAAHAAVAAKVAACRRAGKTSELQLLITNHGKDDGDIHLLGWDETLKPDSLKAMIQAVIDSCLAELNVEMVQCYGGAAADSLKKLDDKKKTTMNVSSAAGGSDPHRSKSGDDGYAVYLKVKVDSLKAGADYEDAVRRGIAEYDSFLVAEGLEGRRGHSVHWRSYPMKTYCDWYKVEVPKGGQLCLEFTGDTQSCGNVVVYEEQADGTKKKVAAWNWNVPGSDYYVPGYNRRVINAAANSTGRFWIHNDNPFKGTYFRLKVISKQNQALPVSPTNLQEMAGHSHGGNDDSAAEFGFMTGNEVFVPNVDQPGANLANLPRAIGQNGVRTLLVSYSNQQAPGWEDMELYLDVLAVEQPGQLFVDAGSVVGLVPVTILEPGIYEIPLGAVPSNFLAFNPPGTYDPITSASFTIDSWGLRIASEATGVADGAPVARGVRVYPSYPNPFNPVSNFAFDIASAGFVRVEVYDVSGARVRTLLNEYRLPGRHEVVWDGRDELNREMGSGVYFWRLTAGGDTRSSKMVLLK